VPIVCVFIYGEKYKLVRKIKAGERLKSREGAEMPERASNSTLGYPDNIDPLILPAVKILNHFGFKTFESCEGGEGHAFPEPTVRFEGTELDLLRAYDICQMMGLPVYETRRVFRKVPVYENDNTPQTIPIGVTWETPFNEITFLR